MLTQAQALKNLQTRFPELPTDAAILGSGWKKALTTATLLGEISFKDWLGVEASVPGHDGKLVLADFGTKKVLVMSGRIHMYEGYTASEATLPIRVLAEAGVKHLLLTAAVGGLNENYQVGDFVVTNDILTLLLSLRGPLSGPQFLDLSEPFSPELRQKALHALTELNLPAREGVYAFIHGPNFESMADKKALRSFGADVVGMSTVPETLVAKWAGMDVVSFAFVTNLAFVKHDHQAVLAQAEAASDSMSALIQKMYS